MYGGGQNEQIGEGSFTASPSGFELVIMAASHGGIAACATVLSRLPDDFPACLVVAQHLAPGMEEPFRAGLARRCFLDVRLARAGAPLIPGTVYVAPAVDQLLIGPDRSMLVDPAKPPARCLADPLLESAAAVVGPGTIAVVLTGRLSDGGRGVQAVKAHGGRVLVQDPVTAAAVGMPTAALATGCSDFCLTPDKIADGLITLVMAPGAAEVFRVPVPHWIPRAVVT